jgi:hypothetical protein
MNPEFAATKHSEGLKSMHWISGFYSEKDFFNSIYTLCETVKPAI